MNSKIRLSDMVDALEMLSDEVDVFLNTRTGEVRPVTEEDRILHREPAPESLQEWEQEALALVREVFESDGWLQLPRRADLRERRIREQFSIEQAERNRRALLTALQARGASGFLYEVGRLHANDFSSVTPPFPR